MVPPELPPRPESPSEPPAEAVVATDMSSGEDRAAGADAPGVDVRWVEGDGDLAPPEHLDAAPPPSPEQPPTVPRAVVPQEVPDDPDLDDPRLLFNRELSWLDFNWRVLAQAQDERLPLLERARFIAITESNLDEFFRKRVGGLKRQIGAGVRLLSPDGRTPGEQLVIAREAVLPMVDAIADTWERDLRPALAEHAGVRIHRYDDLSPEDRAALDGYFLDQVFPILTPLAVDPGHPFPFISNLSLSLAILVRHPVRGTEHFARLKVPPRRGRWVPLPDRPHEVVPLEDLIRHNAHLLFRGMEIVAVHAFRVTRNADLRRNEEEADDLLAMISEEVRERRFADVVRLEVEAAMPQRVRHLLMRELELDTADVYEVATLLNLVDFHGIADFDLPEHRFSDWEPTVPVRLRHTGASEEEADIFSAIRAGDLLVHHPYESFAASVQRFIEEAADDPKVLAIKLTLYRTSKGSPIIDALKRAAENGKLVAALVELKARFDEENNIEWAQQLEKAGVHVTYGLVGLKTHTKTTLVIREEEDGLRTYCHVGTGNYNPKTARLYTDLGLLTCDPVIGRDLVRLFHVLTGYAIEQRYERLLVAPRAMRPHFYALIEREIELAQAGKRGRIVAKMNALDDVGMIQKLYAASRAGVEIDLIVRGHCRMRPGLPGVSENVRICSILGRFLEHSRIYYFHNDGRPELFTGSADWQRRNLDDRVEAIAPVLDAHLQGRLIRTLKHCLNDNRLAWDLRPDGHYIQRSPAEGEEERALHDILMSSALERQHEDDAAWDL
ncbi:MAG: polyphosphate kinase 1 [Bacteroidota bacterium]